MNIGIDHGYYAIKTRHFSFPAGDWFCKHMPQSPLQNRAYQELHGYHLAVQNRWGISLTDCWADPLYFSPAWVTIGENRRREIWHEP